MRVHCIRTAQDTRPLFHVHYRCPWIRVKPKRIHPNNGLPLPIIKDGLFFPVRSRSRDPCIRLLTRYYLLLFKISVDGSGDGQHVSSCRHVFSLLV